MFTLPGLKVLYIFYFGLTISSDRLKIEYRNKEVLISPEDRASFYQEIQARNPKIVIDGAEAVE